MPKLYSRGLTLMASTVLLSLGACDLQGRDEMSWARAALERNAAIEVVATDQQSRTFTVRVKDTGEVRTVRADQVMAAPLAAGDNAGGAASARALAISSVPRFRAAASGLPHSSWNWVIAIPQCVEKKRFWDE